MTAATRNEKHIRSASQVLYLALELGVEESKLAFIPDLEAKPRVRTMPARDLKRLVTEVATAMRWSGLPDSTGVRSCYEAGRDGFWLHRHLATVGIDNRVVDSGSIEVNRRQRRAKSDGLDARKLVTMLVRYHAGESRVWSVVRIPTVEQEDRRQLHRELRTLKQDRVRVTNRIRGLLATQGVRLSKVRDVGAMVEELGYGMAARSPTGCGPACGESGNTRSSCIPRFWNCTAIDHERSNTMAASLSGKSANCYSFGESERTRRGCMCTNSSAGASFGTAKKWAPPLG